MGLLNKKKMNINETIVDNFLLGRIDEKGNYVLEKKIVDELMTCPKILESVYKDTLLLESMYEYGDFGKVLFSIEFNFDEDDDNISVATLRLLEEVKKAGGYIINTKSTILKKVKGNRTKEFRHSIYKLFNLRSGDGEGAKEILENEVLFSEIYKRKMQLLNIKKENAKKREVFEKRKNLEYRKELSKTESGRKILKEIDSYEVSNNAQESNELIESIYDRNKNSLGNEKIKVIENNTEKKDEDIKKSIKANDKSTLNVKEEKVEEKRVEEKKVEEKKNINIILENKNLKEEKNKKIEKIEKIVENKTVNKTKKEDEEIKNSVANKDKSFEEDDIENLVDDLKENDNIDEYFIEDESQLFGNNRNIEINVEKTKIIPKNKENDTDANDALINELGA